MHYAVTEDTKARNIIEEGGHCYFASCWYRLLGLLRRIPLNTALGSIKACNEHQNARIVPA
jgi:hypothetical protein